MCWYAHNIRILAINFAGYKLLCTGEIMFVEVSIRQKNTVELVFSMLSDCTEFLYVTFSCSKDFCLHTVKILVSFWVTGDPE